MLYHKRALWTKHFERSHPKTRIPTSALIYFLPNLHISADTDLPMVIVMQMAKKIRVWCVLIFMVEKKDDKIKGNIGNTDLREPGAPVANNQAATLALSHLPLLHHGLALKHTLTMLIMEISLIIIITMMISIAHLETAVTTRPLSLKLQPSSF